MIDGLAAALITASLVVAGWSLLTTMLNHPVGVSHLAGLAVVELALLVQVVIASARVIAGEGPDETVTFVAYLVGSLLILPAGAVWSLAERTRWSPAVVAAACLILPVMIVRLQQIWQPSGV